MLLRTSIIVILTLTLVGLVGPRPAQAYQKEQTFSLGDPKVLARLAEKTPNPADLCHTPDLRTKNLERNTKASLLVTRFKDPKLFEKMRKNTVENGELYQSWIDEVAVATNGKKNTLKADATPEDYYKHYYEGSPIDLAKRVSKVEIFSFIEHHWPFLKDSIFNELGVERWCPERKRHADDDPSTPYGYQVTADKIQELFAYSTRWSTPKSFVFTLELGGLNFVEISRATVRSGRVGLDISSLHDTNRLNLPEGVDPNAPLPTADGGSSSSGSSNGATNGDNPSTTAAPVTDNAAPMINAPQIPPMNDIAPPQ